MNKLLLISAITLLVGCNNDVKTDGTVTVQGEAKITVTASLEIINQLKELCAMQVAPIEYPSLELKQKATADCVFQHLADIGKPTSVVTDFASLYCNPSADLSGLTPEQLASVQATCTSLGL